MFLFRRGEAPPSPSFMNLHREKRRPAQLLITPRPKQFSSWPPDSLSGFLPCKKSLFRIYPGGPGSVNPLLLEDPKNKLKKALKKALTTTADISGHLLNPPPTHRPPDRPQPRTAWPVSVVLYFWKSLSPLPPATP